MEKPNDKGDAETKGFKQNSLRLVWVKRKGINFMSSNEDASENRETP